MASTIQVSEKLKDALKKRKYSDNETYEDIIWDLLEDTMELSEQAKRRIAQSRAEISAGKTKSLADVKKDLGL